jgi:hypothetical protein
MFVALDFPVSWNPGYVDLVVLQWEHLAELCYLVAVDGALKPTEGVEEIKSVWDEPLPKAGAHGKVKLRRGSMILLPTTRRPESG